MSHIKLYYICNEIRGILIIFDIKKGGKHIAKWQWDQIYDPAITTSLIKYDEEGEIWITIAKYLIKMRVHATINVGTQMVFIYATDDNVDNWEQAFNKVDWKEVGFNSITSIIPGKKERELLEIGGNIILCMQNSSPKNIHDVIQCGFVSLIDYALGNLSDIALDKAFTKLKKVWPELSLKKADLGKQQDANAPPVIPENNLHIKVDVDYNDYEHFRERLPSDLDESIAREVHQLYTNQNWREIEQIYNRLNINNGFPPTDGGYNKHTRLIKAGTKLDRYQKNYAGEIKGEFVSPLTGDVKYSFEERSLKGTIRDYDVYYQIEILEDILVEESTIIPWFGHIGGGIQYKLTENLRELGGRKAFRVLKIEKLKNNTK